MIDRLIAVVGRENIGKLWILSNETYGPNFTEEQALSLAAIARRTEHPKTCLNVPTDSIYVNDSGGYSLIPRKPKEIS